MDSEKLIELVRQHEFLFNYNDKCYSDIPKREMAWWLIGEKLGQSGQTCKKHWTSLRDSFRRNLKKRKSNSEQSVIKKWKFEDNINFLLPYLQDRPSATMLNISISSDDENDQAALDDSPKRLHSSITKEEKVFEQPVSDKKKSIKKVKKKAKVSKETGFALVTKNRFQNGCDQDDEVETLFYSLSQTVKKMEPYYRAVAKSRVCSIIGELEIQNITRQYRTSSRTEPTSSACPSPVISCSSATVSSPIPSPISSES
ncbi:hypothetical protein RN001_013613 [Aquatica leii]|uniref:MADF domain-containing protein n=1 Tax=Aquatica leii TaxID=1421715 RepID=A0AAN7P321_9COLE|nr:hypothetical protein RN001_013613 [Aquatica leii]